MTDPLQEKNIAALRVEVLRLMNDKDKLETEIRALQIVLDQVCQL